MTLAWHGKEFERVVRKNVEQLVGTAAIILQTRMKQQLSHRGAGTWYKGNPAPSSAPGQPPAVQTGNLRRSVQVDLSQQRAPNPTARVGTGIKYGFFLEFGTKHIAPRPWARPSVELTRWTIEGLFTFNALTKGYFKA